MVSYKPLITHLIRSKAKDGGGRIEFSFIQSGRDHLITDLK